MISTLDLEPAVVKSDSIIDPMLKEELKAACVPLEDVPARHKDWHPGSDQKVLDLVHPSLFPLIYGRSRVLQSGKVGVHDCVNFTGKGNIVKIPDDSEVKVSNSYNVGYNIASRGNPKFWSKEFQWLPCDVTFVGEDGVKITSYINNLHPAQNTTLYSVVERIIAKSIPLWNEALSSVRAQNERKPRIDQEGTDYEFPQGQEAPKTEGSEEEDEWERQENWKRSTRVLVLPEPGEYKPFVPSAKRKVNLRKQFAEEGLQVIVKLANVELNPEKPEYEGGSWHIEGQLNEHICASALYYYDCKNITDSFLAFRHRISSDEVELKAYDQVRSKLFPHETFTWLAIKEDSLWALLMILYLG